MSPPLFQHITRWPSVDSSLSSFSHRSDRRTPNPTSSFGPGAQIPCAYVSPLLFQQDVEVWTVQASHRCPITTNRVQNWTCVSFGHSSQALSVVSMSTDGCRVLKTSVRFYTLQMEEFDFREPGCDPNLSISPKIIRLTISTHISATKRSKMTTKRHKWTTWRCKATAERQHDQKGHQMTTNRHKMSKRFT